MLEIKNLTKSYSDTAVLRGVELCFDKKGIYGILAARGSGKTTLARLICGCENVDGGQIALDGEVMSRGAIALKKKVRLVPTTLELDGLTTPIEYLDFVGAAMGVESEKRYRQIKEAIELCDIEDCQTRPFFKLTRPQRARLSLAAALIGNPDVIVLDAPFGANIADVGELLLFLAGIKTVILISSRAADVSQYSDRIAILHGGTIAVSGTLGEIESALNAESWLHLSVRGDKEEIEALLASVEGVTSVTFEKRGSNNTYSYTVAHTCYATIKGKVVSALSGAGYSVISTREEKLTLEDAFAMLSSDKAGGERR